MHKCIESGVDVLVVVGVVDMEIVVAARHRGVGENGRERERERLK